LNGKVIILNVTFRLRKVEEGNGGRVTGLQGDREADSSFLRLDYGGIREELDRMDIRNPGIADVRKAVISIRRRKLPDPAETGNAGSFFKNPVVRGEQFRALRADYPDIPFYPAPGNISPDPDSMKIPAAWLIEQCGWKGYRSGDAGVYPGHSLVLVNYGNATGREIFELATRITDSVEQKFGITLETEVNIVG
jgi:UDP-N-acetylmuramate dehydrogenase